VVQIYIKSPKTGTPVWVNLAKVDRKSFCPVRNLRKLRTVQTGFGVFNKNLPVFRLGSGKNVRPRDLVKLLRNLNRPGVCFMGKSFRAGIPNEMLKNPGFFGPNDVKISGRWKSGAYRAYLREENLDMSLFRKIAKTLLRTHPCL
jgi:hypothetical protein